MARETMEDFSSKNVAGLCQRCKNYIFGTRNCQVYPEGIPEKFLNERELCKDRIPIIEDGKTLDELMNWGYANRIKTVQRELGMTDEEIWEDYCNS